MREKKEVKLGQIMVGEVGEMRCGEVGKAREVEK